MDSTALLQRFRAEVRDEATPYLWSDAEIFGYIDDAQKMFCRMHGGIADSSSALTTLVAAAGAEFVTVSPLILKIRAVRNAATGRDIQLLNYEDLQLGGAGGQYDYGQYVSNFRFDSTPGEVTGAVEGMEPNKLRLVAIPLEETTLKLVLYRMPRLTIDSAGLPLEIDEHHHRHLLHWMKYLAHQKQDAETYDRGRAEQFRNEFEMYCDRAKAERERREHKYRAVAYGGY
jgi:hypothetical protein